MVRVWCSILDSCRPAHRWELAVFERHVQNLYLIRSAVHLRCGTPLDCGVTVHKRGDAWVGTHPDNNFTSSWSRFVLSRRKKPRLNMGDHLVLKSMKNIVICGNWCELWNFVSIVFLNENFSTDTSVSVLHLFQYINRIISIYLCCSPRRHAMQWYKFSLVTRVIPTQPLWRVSEIKCDDPLNLSISISGGKEIKWDFRSSCEWTGIKPIANSYVSYNKRWGVKEFRVERTHGLNIIEWVLREGEKPVWLCLSVESEFLRV